MAHEAATDFGTGAEILEKLALFLLDAQDTESAQRVARLFSEFDDEHALDRILRSARFTDDDMRSFLDGTRTDPVDMFVYAAERTPDTRLDASTKRPRNSATSVRTIFSPSSANAPATPRAPGSGTSAARPSVTAPPAAPSSCSWNASANGPRPSRSRCKQPRSTPPPHWPTSPETRESDDPEGAERLYRAAVDRGYVTALIELAHLREEQHDPQGAQHLYRQAVDAGERFAFQHLNRLTGPEWRMAYIHGGL
ncbi:hypothetical protein [Embleya sp. NPDC020630]|uniref:hypothetical protein n=1 Tax=Embleya sp. NPDC020630 TaxID=3363979 RepID=UPI003789D815